MKKFIISILLLIGVGSGAFFFGKNKGAEKAKSLLEQELPMDRALGEIEEGIMGASNALFYYMVHPSKTSQEDYKHYLAEVNEFMSKYKKLIETDEERAVAKKFDNSWKQVMSKAEALLQARDEFQETQEKAWDRVHEADDVIDYKLQLAFVPGSPNLLKKEKAIREIEVSLWEALNATNYYVYRQFDKPEREYPKQIDDVKELWRTYKNLKLTPPEKSHVAEFEVSWKKAVDLMNKLYTDAEQLTEAQSVFWEAVHKTEGIVDFEFQRHPAKRISK